MNNCIWKGLCLFFVLMTLFLSAIPIIADARSGHGGSTEVIARIVEPTTETQPPTQPFTEPAQPTEPQSGTGKLKITATRPDSAKAKEQSFVYIITGSDHTALTAAIVLDPGETADSVTLSQLPAGEYTVTEENAWSWRFSDADSRTALVGDEPAAVFFDHTLDRIEWLGGFSHRYSD